MRFDPTSFLIGLGAALVVPIVSRVLRPVLVEATAAGMLAWDETRRIVAEQTEALEDLAAEARARRETLLVEGNGHLAEGTPDEAASPSRPRRKSAGGTRRRAEARRSESPEPTST